MILSVQSQILPYRRFTSSLSLSTSQNMIFECTIQNGFIAAFHASLPSQSLSTSKRWLFECTITNLAVSSFSRHHSLLICIHITKRWFLSVQWRGIALICIHITKDDCVQWRSRGTLSEISMKTKSNHALSFSTGRGCLAVGMYAKSKACIWANKTVSTGLKEYSVIYTDRAVNMLSEPFIKAMQKISVTMNQIKAEGVALIPEAERMPWRAVRDSSVLENVFWSFVTDISVFVGRTSWTRSRSPTMSPCSRQNPRVRVVRTHLALRLPRSRKLWMRSRHRNPMLCLHLTSRRLPVSFSRTITSRSCSAAHDVGALFVLDCVASSVQDLSLSHFKTQTNNNRYLGDMKKTGVDAIVSAAERLDRTRMLWSCHVEQTCRGQNSRR